MTSIDQHFPDQKRFRNAKLIEPEHILKKKAGSGGINPELLHKAQESIDNNKVDFAPIAKDLLLRLLTATQDNKATREQKLEAIIEPVLHIKSQGGMFHYPLMSDIGHILIDFLETVPELDTDVIDIVLAHHKSMQAVLSMTENERDAAATMLCAELLNACGRYHAKHGLKRA
jgi:hypothetical protein